ncbi:MAG: PHB depolymerase family esterase [Patescibacteria group bacterium]
MRIPKKIVTKLFFGVSLLLFIFFVKQFLLPVFLFSEVDIDGNITNYIYHNNLRRSYVVHQPENYDASKSLPLVFAFHCAGSNAQIMIRLTNLNKLSDEENFLVVYPNGTGLFENYLLTWNAGGCCDFIGPVVDDVDFTKTVFAQLQEDYNIDLNRVYVLGFSNGAMMAHRLGCELSDKLAAIAPVSGSLVEGGCDPEDFLSVISLHSKDDTFVPFYGGEADRWFINMFDVNFPPVEDSIRFWADHNKCARGPEIKKEGAIELEKYTNCKNNTEVYFYSLEGYDHVWLGGGRGVLPMDISDDIIISDVIWDFFENHPKKR